MAKKKDPIEVVETEVTEPVVEVEAAVEVEYEAAQEPSVETFEPAVVIPTDAPISVFEAQLNIYESKVVAVPEGAKRIIVENVGGGDLYVDTIAFQYDPKYRVAPGASKEFKGAKNILIGSASRPLVRVTFLKK
jgi:hypothetical protein